MVKGHPRISLSFQWQVGVNDIKSYIFERSLKTIESSFLNPYRQRVKMDAATHRHSSWIQISLRPNLEIYSHVCLLYLASSQIVSFCRVLVLTPTQFLKFCDCIGTTTMCYFAKWELPVYNIFLNQSFSFSNRSGKG